jgi:hypothetical protein
MRKNFFSILLKNNRKAGIVTGFSVTAIDTTFYTVHIQFP